MTAQSASVGQCQIGSCEEAGPSSLPVNDAPTTQIQNKEHGNLLTMDTALKMEDISMMRAAYVPPRHPAVRQRGIRGELLQLHLTREISKQTHAEFNPETPKTDFSSTTQRDFTVVGFVPGDPMRTQDYQGHDYKTDQAITFWSENHQHVQETTIAKLTVIGARPLEHNYIDE